MFTGVTVSRSNGSVDIHAPLVISDAGVVNTFTKLLPQEIANQSSMPLSSDNLTHYKYYCLVVILANDT